MSEPEHHIPVLVEEVIALFDPQPGDSLLDATVGGGGHAAAYLDRTGPTGHVVGFDADERSLGYAADKLKPYGTAATLHHENFFNLKDSFKGGGILPKEFTHVLFDLGFASHQLLDHARGFSFASATSLAMRYGEGDNLPAAQIAALNRVSKRLGYHPDVPDLLEALTAEELAQVLRAYGEERYARRVAAAIKETTPLPATATALADVVRQAVPSQYERGRIHPATRTFQALRVAVNRELEALEQALPQALELLAETGKLAVISFHSLEDRIVKRWMRAEAKGCICPPVQPICTCGRSPRVEIVTKKPVRASASELTQNPRARSAKLRVARKIRSPATPRTM